MQAKLRALRGKLTTRRGTSAGVEIAVRGPRFLIGSSDDCKLCCRSNAISPHHCELTTTQGALWVNDLGSHTGTFVNDVRTVGKTRVTTGDRLRVGRLEFEVVLVAEPPGGRPRRDSISEQVSDLLSDADAEERARRMADPSARNFDIPGEDPVAVDKESEAVLEQPARPRRQPPKKLPPPPELVADDSVQAADETLKKILERLKGPKR